MVLFERDKRETEKGQWNGPILFENNRLSGLKQEDNPVK
jgi:hypothetical protein